MKRFRVYLSKKFTLVTDHKALQWLKSLNMHDEKGRRGRWIEFIQQFELELVHKPGRSPELAMADYLSRIVEDGLGKDIERAIIVAGVTDTTDPPPTEMLGLEKLRVSQMECPVLSEIKRLLCLAEKGEWNGEMRSVMEKKVWDRLFVDERGLLMIQFNGGQRTKNHQFGVRKKSRVVVPRALIPLALKTVHRGGLGGHMGQDRTWKRLRDSFYWKNMKQDVDEYIDDCEECGRNKHSTHPNKAPFQETNLPVVPLEHLQIDFAGPFPAAQTHPYRYVLQVIDVLSRFVRMTPCKEDTSVATIEALLNQWICVFGVPVSMNSDRGTHFTSEVFKGICKVLGVDHRYGAPKHPQSQGMVERQNQLLAQVRCVCDNNKENWPDAVHRVAFSHNISENATTGFAPLQIITGQEVRDPERIWIRDQKRLLPDNKPDKSYMEKVLQEKEIGLKLQVEEARNRTREAQCARMEKQITLGEPYKVGDIVRMKMDSAEVKKMGKKMAHRFSGKYQVVEILGHGWTFRLQPLGWKGRMKERHFNELKEVRRVVRSDTSDSDEEYRQEKGNHQEVEIYPDAATTEEYIDRNDAPLTLDPSNQVEAKTEEDPCPPLRRSSRAKAPPKRLVMSYHTKKYDDCREALSERSMSSSENISDDEISSGGSLSESLEDGC